MTQDASIKIPSSINLCGGELRNVKFQSLISKDDATEAEFWYDSVTHKPMYNNGTTNKEFGKEYSNFVGADGTSAGVAGLVPAPSATDNDKYLCGDGTFKAPEGTSYYAGNGLNLSNNTFSVSTTIASKTDIGDGKTVFKKNGTAIGTISANQTSSVNVDFTIPTAVADLSDASNYALKSDVASAIIPRGSVSYVSELPSPSSSYLGWMYNFSIGFTTTADFVEGAGKYYPAGTNVVIVDYSTISQDHYYKYDIFSGFVDTTTYDTHIADTTIHVTATEKTTWNGKQDALTAGSNITISGGTISATNTTYSAGNNITISNGTISATDTTYTFSTGLTKNGSTVSVTDYNKLAKKFTATIPATTTSSGVASWTITNSLTTADVDVSIYEVGSTSNTKVYPAVDVNASKIIVNLLSASNISAGAYKAVITG